MSLDRVFTSRVISFQYVEGKLRYYITHKCHIQNFNECFLIKIVNTIIYEINFEMNEPTQQEITWIFRYSCSAYKGAMFLVLVNFPGFFSEFSFCDIIIFLIMVFDVNKHKTCTCAYVYLLDQRFINQ